MKNLKKYPINKTNDDMIWFFKTNRAACKIADFKSDLKINY